MRGLFLSALTMAALPAIAQPPVLEIPLDCTLGKDCYINDYFDRDTSAGILDYQCGAVTRDNHRGVDFALRTLEQMRRGVDVIAAAPGRVRGVRDELPDIANTDPNAPNIVGRECGNGLSIDHGNGWMTQYCHLKLDSIVVSPGDTVDTGTVLGQVGLSGQTNYPHVHFSTFKDRKHMDPFQPDPNANCGVARDSLWADTPNYQPGGLIRIGLAGTPPKLSNVGDTVQSAPDIPANAPAFVIWAHGYSVQKGDVLLS
ncbi:MAG: M23 family metallopeptidase, partial [Pseudomonadota bacterium]